MSEHIRLFGSELPEYRDPGGWDGGFGELPDDLREMGDPSDPSEDGVHTSSGPTLEQDGFSLNGGADRRTVEPVPPLAGTKFVGVNALPRANFESFRSQRFEQTGTAIILPSSGTTFVPLATFTIPSTFAGVLTGLNQWIGDASAYLKANGTVDDILWRITINDSLVFNYGALNAVVSTATTENKLFVILNENTTVTLSAASSLAVGSFGARAIPVRGTLAGYQFPIDEVDDIFKNR